MKWFCAAHITSPLDWTGDLLSIVKQLKQLTSQCTESNVCLTAKTLPHRSPLVTPSSRPMRAQAWASLRSDWSIPVTPLPRAVITRLARHMLRLTVGVSPHHLAFAILLNSQINAMLKNVGKMVSWLSPPSYPSHLKYSQISGFCLTIKSMLKDTKVWLVNCFQIVTSTIKIDTNWKRHRCTSWKIPIVKISLHFQRHQNACWCWQWCRSSH